MFPLLKQLKYCVPHRLPHFERHYELGAPHVLSFKNVDCREWHREYVSRIKGAVGCGKHFPVFRISHGEFILAVGYQVLAGATLRSRLIHNYQGWKRRLGLIPAFLSGSKDNSCETFTRDEIARAREIYVTCLRNIANEGILAIALNRNAGYIEYIPKYLAWLERKQILLHEDNYMPFYSIYALLLGPEGAHLFRAKKLLIITSFDAEKKASLECELYRRGAESVQCISISPTRAMFDTIDIDGINRPVDIALIGAGVGAASVIEQIRPLGVVAIDAGFALDALAYPSKRWNRPYCVSDEEFQLDKIRFLDSSDIEMLRQLNISQGKSCATLDQAKEMLMNRVDGKQDVGGPQK